MQQQYGDCQRGHLIAQTNSVGGTFAAFNLLGDRLLVWNRDSAVLGTARLLEPVTLRLLGGISNVALASLDPFAERTGLIASFSGNSVAVHSDRDASWVADPFDCGRLVDDIAFSDDGRRVAVTIHDAGLMVFALRKSGKEETAVQLRPGTHRVAFTEDGQLFACAGTNQAVGVAEADGGVKESESTSAIRSKSRSETGSGMMNRVVEVRETATG